MTRPMHAMLDFETQSLKHNAALISCGIALFTSDGKIHDIYYCNMIPHKSAHVCERTLQWWSEQSCEAKELLNHCKLPFEQAIQEITKFLSRAEYLWSHGVASDVIWLESAVEMAGIEMPISYRQYRCFRTLMALKPESMRFEPTTPHYALDDAIAQALTLTAAYGAAIDT